MIALFFPMATCVRRLPGDKGLLMDKTKFPEGQLFYNPSVDQEGTYIYLRNTELKGAYENNQFILYQPSTQDLRKITMPRGFLLPTYNAYRGIEDARIVMHKGALWFTATSTHATNDMRNTMILGRLNNQATEVDYITVLRNFKPPIKNISPFVYKDELCLLDAYDMKLYKITEDNDEFVATFWKDIKHGSGFDKQASRGSTSPVHLHGNTWGYIVHDVIFNDSNSLPGSKLSYYHYWVEMDIERGVITFQSSPFWLMHWGIEFVSGLRLDKATNLVYLYFGVKDEAPCLCTVPLHDLRCGKS